MKWRNAYTELSEELNLPRDVIKDVVEGYFQGVASACTGIPYPKEAPDENFNPTIVNIKKVGRLVFDRKRAEYLYRKNLKFANNAEYKDGEANVHQDNNNL